LHYFFLLVGIWIRDKLNFFFSRCWWISRGWRM